MRGSVVTGSDDTIIMGIIGKRGAAGKSPRSVIYGR
jgi:hypothetical protein